MPCGSHTQGLLYKPLLHQEGLSVPDRLLNFICPGSYVDPWHYGPKDKPTGPHAEALHGSTDHAALFSEPP